MGAGRSRLGKHRLAVIWSERRGVIGRSLVLRIIPSHLTAAIALPFGLPERAVYVRSAPIPALGRSGWQAAPASPHRPHPRYDAVLKRWSA